MDISALLKSQPSMKNKVGHYTEIEEEFKKQFDFSDKIASFYFKKGQDPHLGGLSISLNEGKLSFYHIYEGTNIDLFDMDVPKRTIVLSIDNVYDGNPIYKDYHYEGLGYMIITPPKKGEVIIKVKPNKYLKGYYPHTVYNNGEVVAIL